MSLVSAQVGFVRNAHAVRWLLFWGVCESACFWRLNARLGRLLVHGGVYEGVFFGVVDAQRGTWW